VSGLVHGGLRTIFLPPVEHALRDNTPCHLLPSTLLTKPVASTAQSCGVRIVPLSCQNGRKTAVASGHPRASRSAPDLDWRRLTPCLKRPVTKLLASPVTVWNRRRCLRLAQRGQCPSDKPVGDHGGSLACPLGVSSIRGSPVRGMKSSKQLVTAELVR
jgi:hypothetical protein